MRSLETDHVVSATAKDPNPANSPNMFFFGEFLFAVPERKFVQNKEKKKIVSSHGHIRWTQFDQKSPGPLEEGVLRRHKQTHRQTDIQTDIETL